MLDPQAYNEGSSVSGLHKDSIAKRRLFLPPHVAEAKYLCLSAFVERIPPWRDEWAANLKNAIMGRTAHEQHLSVS